MPAIVLLFVQATKNIFYVNTVLDQFFSSGPGATIPLVFTDHDFQSTFDGLSFCASSESLLCFFDFSLIQ
jgi:hypothetical protein